MKVTIECHTLEESIHRIQAYTAWDALKEIDNVCRNQLKHGSPDSDRLTLDRVRELALEALRSIE